MYGLLIGNYHPDSECFVTKGGLGFSINHCGEKLEETEEPVTLFAITLMRESSISIWTFDDKYGKQLFKFLTDRPGVGPATAAAILRHFGSTQAGATLQNKDEKALTEVHGLGKAGVRKLLSSYAEFPEELRVSTQAEDVSDPEIRGQVLTILTAQKFPVTGIKKALDQVEQEHADTLTLTETIQEVLKLLNEEAF